MHELLNITWTNLLNTLCHYYAQHTDKYIYIYAAYRPPNIIKHKRTRSSILQGNYEGKFVNLRKLS